MRITAPQHLPWEYWSDAMEQSEREESTAFTYEQMFDAIRHCFS
ncbi:hypothetical protein [Amycolatopsis sp. WGS_07]